MEHINGPTEPQHEDINEQVTEEELQQWQLEHWQAQHGQASQESTAQPVAKRSLNRAPRQDQGEKLDARRLTMDSLQRRVAELVKVSVDMDDNEAQDLELDQALLQVGITSKPAVSLRTAIAEELPAVNLPFTLVFDYPSINAISEYVLDQT